MPRKTRFNSLRKPADNPIVRPLIIPVFIPHAGCPHQCVFCNQRTITGIDARIPSRTAIVQFIESFLRHSSATRSPVEIAFYGGNFLGLSSDTIDFLLDTVRPFIEQARVQSLRCSTRPDSISPETLDRLAAFPFSTIEIGVQSMDDAVLNRSQRGHTVQDNTSAISLAKAAGYRVGAQLMIGLPDDSKTRAVETATRISDMLPDFVRIYPTVVLKGSLLAKWFAAGNYTPLRLDQAIDQAKSMMRVFQCRRIPVIRMGLQPSECLTQSREILAGPFHPAFGFLVVASHFRDMTCAILDGWSNIPPHIQIHVNPRNDSAVRGHKNETIVALKQRYPVHHIDVILDNSLSAGHIQITSADGSGLPSA
ncbi:MAG: elongator complex protein 3 [Desulfatirhabdiaceae bacterium]